jgi:SAM-dependent methyltransferase
MLEDYVHGYSAREQHRLYDQSEVLASLLHDDTAFEPGARVLEVGCGVGAQTRIIARRNPHSHFTCIDISESSLQQAAALARMSGLTNVTFVQADVRQYQVGTTPFDHALFCFVLEHVREPQAVLQQVCQLVRPSGTVTAIEGDHGSTYFYPPSARAWRTIQCLIDLQARAGADALIGRRLYPLFCAAGLSNVQVSPRVVYADPSRPAWVEGFTLRTYIAMVEGARDRALASNLISAEDWELGINDLYQSVNGTFNYTFFKAIGRVGSGPTD